MLKTTEEKNVKKETKRSEMTKLLLNKIHKSEDTSLTHTKYWWLNSRQQWWVWWRWVWWRWVWWSIHNLTAWLFCLWRYLALCSLISKLLSANRRKFPFLTYLSNNLLGYSVIVRCFAFAIRNSTSLCAIINRTLSNDDDWVTHTSLMYNKTGLEPTRNVQNVYKDKRQSRRWVRRLEVLL